MDTTQRLSDYISQNSTNQNEGTTRQFQDFNAFLTVFSINLVHRYPGVTTELDSIQVPTIENIARLSAVCSTVAVEVWTDLLWKRQRGVSRQTTRAA